MPLPRLWPLLFPLTYAIHIAEELWGGFPDWARVLGMQFDPTRFLQLNAVAWTVMAALSTAAVFTARVRWVVIAFAAAVSLNGLAHAAASVVTASYSPGLVSGLLLWVPLGLYTLRCARVAMPALAFWGAAGGGVLMHTLVTLFARFG